MSKELSYFTEEEFISEFGVAVKRLVLAPKLKPCERPQAVLLGGQSGAGKTKLHKIINSEFSGNIVVINGDEYRSSHPHYHDLDKAYGPEAVSHTAVWAGKMTESLISSLSKMSYNLIIEGTLRTAEVPIKTATLLRERGYDVSLALMAVKPEISLVSCQIRYELMRLEGTIPRATDPKHHNKIIEDIVSNLDCLENSGLFDEVRLFSRSEACLYASKKDAGSASQALKDVLFGAWTQEEQIHYAFLQDQLAHLKALNG